MARDRREMTLARQHGELDAEQFAALVSPHLVALRRYAATRGSLQDAEDLVQDAQARAWTKRAQFEPERGPMVAWLIAILTDRARQRWRAGDRPLALDGGDRSTPGPDGVRVDLRRAVNALPQRQQLAIVACSARSRRCVDCGAFPRRWIGCLGGWAD
jgi:RNA polymerase sigma-70 factor (ECF subfamily)